jgi:hypothetical protein
MSNIKTDTCNLAKWLNEEPNREIDRPALARVLAHLQQAEQSKYPDNFIDALKFDVARRDSEAQQAYEDAFVKGNGALLGDKRIDPSTIYAEQEQPVAWYYRFKNKSGWGAWATAPVGSEKPVNVAFEDMECHPLVFGDTAPPPHQPDHGDSARLDWLTNNPLEALDIFGHVKGDNAVRWIRQDIDNHIKGAT